jgi:hypothetical protein
VLASRKSSEDGSSKRIDQQLTVTQITLSTTTASVPPPVGETSSIIRSSAEARDFARQLHEYLEGLKDAEADQEGTCSSFTASTI